MPPLMFVLLERARIKGEAYLGKSILKSGSRFGV